MGIVPIGEPYPDMDVLVVDEALREVAAGETGELLMTGPRPRSATGTIPTRLRPPSSRRRVATGCSTATGDRVRRPRATAP
jgi:non-ribosomal peptide synthetase component F